MHVDTTLAYRPASAHRALVARLISLAEEMDRAGLRREATVILAMAYSVLDGDDVE